MTTAALQQNSSDILALIQDVRANLDRIEALLSPHQASEDENGLDPKSPLNKNGLNLTPRGVEVCYRMFDVGKTRYAVSEALDISYGAATHRFHAWEKAGGTNRKKSILESYEAKYGSNAADVLSSKNKVAAAGRWGDPTEAREQHREQKPSARYPAAHAIAAPPSRCSTLPANRCWCPTSTPHPTS